MSDQHDCRDDLNAEIEALRRRVSELESSRDSAQGHLQLLNSVPDAVFTLDRERRYTFANASAARLVGKPRDHVQGARITDLVPGIESTPFFKAYEQVMNGGPAETVTDRFAHADGCDEWRDVRVNPLPDGILCIVFDGTARAVAEEAQRRRAALLHSTIESLPFDFFALDADGRYFMLNSVCRDHWGDIAGKRPEDVAPDEATRDLWVRNNKRAFSGEVISEEVTTRRGEVELRLHNVISPILHDGAVEGILGVNIDVTDRTRATEALRRERDFANALINAPKDTVFVFDPAAHRPIRWNANFTTVSGYTDEEIARMRAPEDFHGPEDLARAAELTQQLLGFARKGKFRNAPIDMHQAIGNMVSILGHTIDRRIAIRQRLNARAAVVNGDRGQLDQVLMNIAINARDAMPDGGELVFETGVATLDEEYCSRHAEASPGTYLCVSISDTGMGIPDDVLPRMFDPFYTTKDIGKGTGMGLAMVYGIVKNHNGHLTVETALGAGTTFKLCLPLETTRLPETDSGELKPIGKLSGRILVVDDEEGVRSVIASILTLRGCSVVCMPDGRKAVEYYGAHVDEVDLVILDLGMPDMDGRECLTALKEVNPNVKVVITTGHGLDNTQQKLLDAGALRFLRKPFSPTELSEAVAKALGVRGNVTSKT